MIITTTTCLPRFPSLLSLSAHCVDPSGIPNGIAIIRFKDALVANHGRITDALLSTAIQSTIFAHAIIIVVR